MKLRPPQIATLDSLAGKLRQGERRIVVQAPTGFGKTVVAGRMIKGHLAKGGRPTFVAPAISLIDQTVQRLVEYGIPLSDIGVIQGDHPMTDMNRPVQVATAQSLARRNPRRMKTTMVIVDECHRMFNSIHEWMASWSLVPFIGLSATPWAKGMGKHWQSLVCETSIGDLISQGYLSPYRVFAASHPDLTGVRVKRGDYVESELSEAMQAGALVGNTVSHWLKHGADLPTLAFCVDRAHAKAMQREFEAAGVTAGYVDAYTDRDEREEISKAFHAGDMRVVCSVGCLTTGIDWDVRCIVLARPTKSPMLYVQIIGRGLRTAEGKRDCLILDHSDTTLRLGFPEEVEAEHRYLDGGKENQSARQEREEPLPKECNQCGYIKPAKVHKCPSCGFAPERQPEVEHVDAELVEIGGTKTQRKHNRDTPSEQKALWYAGLKQYGMERGYKPGWADNQYKQRFGVWPNHYKTVQAQAPTPELLSWIKSQQIRYAKRRAA
jgi:superfamily II DNA or RNA helicase